MKMDSLFEQQRFNQKWILLLEIALAAVGTAIAIAAIASKVTGILPAVSPLLAILGIIALFRTMKLEIEIQNDFIRFRFFPLRIRWKIIPKADIRQIAVVKYNPIKDYGGWGIRIGSKGWAYTVKGNDGISILLASGKHILIGTAKPKEVSAFLEKCGYNRLSCGCLLIN
ncbi:hypothetical protein [Dinghuibacter silviterrae]|uniref:PH (Pleckstrin Homology) domain-containing protein n=1 Tax=Dinghuibacter silviterrae TaxID=1539049 RepID=A0A4R8DSL9_9BACT|nr:hypothetical protein [Dinghuibacter silviterrae]TDX00387.1 hypothetical protein EDB95_1409 [Dinghuibacter silviterrae]